MSGQFVYLLTLFGLLAQSCTSSPQNPRQRFKGRDVKAENEISRSFIEKDCDPEDKQKILDAWQGARKLANALTGSVSGYDYNIPHTQWLGKDWNSES
jgi:hypothetical protein